MSLPSTASSGRGFVVGAALAALLGVLFTWGALQWVDPGIDGFGQVGVLLWLLLLGTPASLGLVAVGLHLARRHEEAKGLWFAALVSPLIGFGSCFLASVAMS